MARTQAAPGLPTPLLIADSRLFAVQPVQKPAQEAPLRSRSPVSDLLNLRFIDGHYAWQHYPPPKLNSPKALLTWSSVSWVSAAARSVPARTISITKSGCSANLARRVRIGPSTA